MSGRRRPKTTQPRGRGEAGAGAVNAQVRTLLHELQVHSEELTVQNEQLRRAQAELEDARDRYANLYDFAPVAMMTLSSHGAILEANIAAASLLQRSRAMLLGLPLAGLIDERSREAVRRFLGSLGSPDAPQAQVEVRFAREQRIAQITGRRVHPHRADEADVRIFASLIDVTAERELEQERQTAYEREQQRAAELSREVAIRAVAEERVKALLERLVTIQEQERRRLALNLHDHLGQQLTALRLAISGLRDAADPTGVMAQMELIEQIVSQLDRDVDFLAWELRPAALDDVGLEAALTEFVRQWSWANGVSGDFHHRSQDSRRLPADVESHLYRICQEALNNVSKHAGAAHVSVLLNRCADEATLIVEDDGRGFDPEGQRDRLRSGMGLAGMQERAALLGGEVELESSPGKGTTLFVRVPLRKLASTTPPSNTGKSRP